MSIDGGAGSLPVRGVVERTVEEPIRLRQGPRPVGQCQLGRRQIHDRVPTDRPPQELALDGKPERIDLLGIRSGERSDHGAAVGLEGHQ